ncbi:hypothetical protein BLNAU_19689 [Blattamonas nauphoetae]|uniref:CRESS-DNA virus Rep endonuclease domain-containing protein n=1 Tax=Blattamonas nauphoetae TaxID=2049346 RepID=A0ABQ9X0Z0_9EUKA|nr:hypothetical protein BLNAU_19689 [Blattamonas nauphoetae]
MVFGHEVGDSGTPHLQGYIVFQTIKSLSQAKTIIPRAHWEQAKGSLERNYIYCTKQPDSNPVEIGVRPVGQGKRTDLSDAGKLLRETRSMESH